MYISPPYSHNNLHDQLNYNLHYSLQIIICNFNYPYTVNYIYKEAE